MTRVHTVQSELETRVHRVVDDVLDEMADDGQLAELAETTNGVRVLAKAAVPDTEEYQRLKTGTLKLAVKRIEQAAAGRGKRIEDNTLFRLLGLIAKLDLEVGRRLSELPANPVENVLMIVRQDGLPVDRQADLLARAFREVGGDEYRRALVELVGPDEAAERLTIEEGDSP